MNMFKSFINALKIVPCKAIKLTTCFNYFQLHTLCRQLHFSSNSHGNILSNEKLNLMKASSQCFEFCSYSKEIHNLSESILNQDSDGNSPSKKEDLVKILDFLVSRGYSFKKIKEKSLSYLTSTNSSFEKITLIAELDVNFLELLPFINLSLSTLRKAAQQAREDKYEIKDFSNRFSYLSHHLETPLENLIPVLSKHTSLITMPFSRLHQKMLILKNAAICPRDLVKDLWIFNYREKLMTDRISAAEEVGVKLKPWMLRCSTKFFTSRLKKEFETHRILGDQDVATYLSRKLDCKEDYIEVMMERNRLLKTISIPKLDKILTFLFEKGYTPQEIRLFPKVFSTKLETLDERLKYYSKTYYTLPPIPQLCLSSKVYQSKIEKHNK